MSNTFLRMADLDLANQRVLIREDLNVPLSDGKITDDSRIQRALPTIQAALSAGARVIVLSHLGRPKEGQFDAEFSLAPVAQALSDTLQQDVSLVDNWLDGVDVAPGQIVLAENVRFLSGEKQNKPELAQRMAAQCDLFVMDAFASAHRAQASTSGVGQYAAKACAGPLLCAELDALSSTLDHPKPPVIAIVGGSKVSTKIQLLDTLLDKVDCLITGGGIANTLLAAAGYPIGQSLFEAEWIERSQKLIETAQAQQVNLPLPTDVVVADRFSADAQATTKPITDVTDTDMILDVGPDTSAAYAKLIQQAGTIIWNGPVGVFEFEAFSHGTRHLAQAVANSPAYSIAGGGDTVAAINQFGLKQNISYISTGGGAFLELLEGNTLPAIAMLNQRA